MIVAMYRRYVVNTSDVVGLRRAVNVNWDEGLWLQVAELRLRARKL